MQETLTTGSAGGGLRIHPPLLALGCLAGALFLHMLMPWARAVSAHQLAGLLLVAGATGLCFYAAAIFQGAGTTKNPYGEPATLVTRMPYSLTRNPMYLGLGTVLLGLAIFFGAAEMMIAPIAFFAVIDRMVIPREEETLERLFGADYVEYRRRVRRWL